MIQEITIKVYNFHRYIINCKISYLKYPKAQELQWKGGEETVGVKMMAAPTGIKCLAPRAMFVVTRQS